MYSLGTRLKTGSRMHAQGEAASIARNKLRIIGGQWRGRKLEFPALVAIRPTPDRVRETLFNWLQNDIVGAHCLDLFAGSGALGVEALSRGAASVVFVDSDVRIVRYLREVLRRLNANNGEVHCSEALNFLAGTARSAFDVVFLDPPFSGNELVSACKALTAPGLLAAGALIYLENRGDEGLPELPADWELLKSKQAGQVGYHLARRR